MQRQRGEGFEEKRAALRRAAARLLAESPAQTPSAPAVAAEAGMAQGAVAYYYGNLGNLLWALVSNHLKTLLARLEAEVPETMPPRQRLLALTRSYCAVVQDCGPEHRIALQYQLRLTPARSRDAEQMQRWVLHLFEETLTAALPASAAARATPLALTLLSLLNGHAQWFREGKSLCRTGFAEMAARMVLSEVPARARAARKPAGVAGSSCNGLREAA